MVLLDYERGCSLYTTSGQSAWKLTSPGSRGQGRRRGWLQGTAQVLVVPDGEAYDIYRLAVERSIETQGFMTFVQDNLVVNFPNLPSPRCKCAAPQRLPAHAMRAEAATVSEGETTPPRFAYRHYMPNAKVEIRVIPRSFRNP